MRTCLVASLAALVAMSIAFIAQPCFAQVPVVEASGSVAVPVMEPPQEPLPSQPPPLVLPAPPATQGTWPQSGYQVAPPPAYGGAYPPGAYVVQQYNVAPLDRVAAYDAQTKSVVLAVVLDLLIPGVGNIYADNVLNAALTWAGLATGIVLMVKGLSGCAAYATGTCDEGTAVAGMLVLMGSYLFGVVSAGFSAASYNERLAERMGLRQPLVFTPFLAPHANGGIGGVAVRF